MAEKRMTATERDAFMNLSVADQIVTNVLRDLGEERLKMVPHMKRDLRMIETVLERVLLGLMDTIPAAQKRTFANALRDCSFTVGVKCRARDSETTRKDNYGLYLTFHQLEVLFDACKEKCHYCGLDAEGIRRCALRKAMDEIPNDAPDSDGSDCPYYRVM